MKLNEIRSIFLDFFARNGHAILPSSGLVPHNDPSLMFTNAGMVQFKNYFTQSQKPQFLRAASSQKCVRAGGKHNDLENVGYTARHHTFFEMLGNFSFGDYFKDDAIDFAWRCLTQEFGIDKSRLYITIYHNDDEAFSIWKKVTGFSDDKIIRINNNDNFWAMGDVGPCGPCSEIFYDNGPTVFGGLPGTKDQDGDRYKEIWNLVFMQFEDCADGKRIQLPKPAIDTGMGLERIAAVLQGHLDNYDIDLFRELINASKKATGNYNDSPSHKVIADHLRAMSFLIADGIMPSNEGRGYVLRRIMRRAMRHAYQLGKKEPVLFTLVKCLVEQMPSYNELQIAQKAIESCIESEEQRFIEMLDRGMKILNTAKDSIKSTKILDAQTAFKLYDTYGFPLDLTADILRSEDIAVDFEGFQKAMQEQKAKARAAWAGSGENATSQTWLKLYDELGATQFLGYTMQEAMASITAIVDSDNTLESLEGQKEGWIVLNQTPFYAESGGQVGDIGFLDDIQIIDTKKFADGIVGHKAKLQNGQTLKVGQTVTAKIDESRNLIRANHSATHLLHYALKEVLGSHVVQKGSMVNQDKLRFDFAHNKPLSLQELEKVEQLVNILIVRNTPIDTTIMNKEDAIKKGAMALFGEKYSDEVRVVSMGPSTELCGGTHAKSTGDIGVFKIISQEAVAAGIRRIEAITGIKAVQYNFANETKIYAIASHLKCKAADLESKITEIQNEAKHLGRQVSAMQIDLAVTYGVEKEAVAGVNLVWQHLKSTPSGLLREIATILLAKNQDAIVVVATQATDKASMVIAVNPKVSNKHDALTLIKIAAECLGGSGGGSASFAQAGGPKISEIQRSIQAIKQKLQGNTW